MGALAADGGELAGGGAPSVTAVTLPSLPMTKRTAIRPARLIAEQPGFVAFAQPTEPRAHGTCRISVGGSRPETSIDVARNEGGAPGGR